MPQRVDTSDVTAIISTALDVQPFITVASLLIDRHLVGKGVSDALLFEIERWLAAHFVAVRQPRATEQADGDTRVRYERGKQGEGLSATTYGQQAIALDVTGTLAKLSKGVTVVFAVD